MSTRALTSECEVRKVRAFLRLDKNHTWGLHGAYMRCLGGKFRVDLRGVSW